MLCYKDKGGQNTDNVTQINARTFTSLHTYAKDNKMLRGIEYLGLLE